MLLAIIVLGFAMMTIGVALVFVGETPFISGKRIPALRARLIGLVLMSFLPLAFVVWQGARAIFEEGTIHGPVITWSLFVLCWLTVLGILFPLFLSKRERRPSSSRTPDKGTLFEDSPPLENPASEIEPVKNAPVKKAAIVKLPSEPKKTPRRPVEEKDPFDFS